MQCLFEWSLNIDVGVNENVYKQTSKTGLNATSYTIKSKILGNMLGKNSFAEWYFFFTASYETVFAYQKQDFSDSKYKMKQIWNSMTILSTHLSN